MDKGGAMNDGQVIMDGFVKLLCYELLDIVVGEVMP